MGFFHDRTRVRLWSREYGAYERADEGGEIIVLRRDHATLDEGRAARCLVRDADQYVLFYGAACGRNLVQIVDGESPGGGDHETNHAVQATQAPASAAKEPAPPAMEFFPDRTHVWLWIREHEAYLYAGDEDGEEIAISGDLGAAPLCGAWAVHRLVRDDTDYVLFHSASDGRYLAILQDENHCFPAQCTYDSPEQNNVLFQAVRADEDDSDDLFLRHFTFDIWCRPADEDTRTPTPLHWVVEAIPPRPLPPQLPVPPKPLRTQLVGGPVVPNLRRDLAAELGEANNGLGIALCVWAGPNGRLIPLVMDLTSNENTMSTVVLTANSLDFKLTPVTDPSDDQPMDMVLSQDDICNTIPSRMVLHSLPSRITEEQIGGMRVFLMCVGDQNFLNIFNDCLEPIPDLVEQENSYREFVGNPLQQTVESTCAIVSTVKCVEMQHRREYETYYGLGTFPCEAASPRKLRSLCRREKLWTADGAYVGNVMKLIKRVGGISTTNAPPPAPYLLPLRSWEQHRWDAGHGLTADRIMELLDSRGPFVGTFWVCPWYSLFDASEDGHLVYRSGCARSKLMQDWSESCFGQYKVSVGLHSVVCFAYRVIGGDLHILVLDNNSPTGPERWIHYFELQEVHTLSVDKLDPPVHLGRQALVYPKSRY